MVSLCGMLQSPVQAVVRPSMWLPGVRKIHSHTQMRLHMKFGFKWPYSFREEIFKMMKGLELPLSFFPRWRTEASSQEFAKEVIEAITRVMEQDNNTEFLDIHKVTSDGRFFRIFAFTKAEWLDVVELQYTDGFVRAHSFSSGLVPLIVPFAALCNIVCFCAPFLDFNFNENRLNRIRLAMKINVERYEETL